MSTHTHTDNEGFVCITNDVLRLIDLHTYTYLIGEKRARNIYGENVYIDMLHIYLFA